MTEEKKTAETLSLDDYLYITARAETNASMAN